MKPPCFGGEHEQSRTELVAHRRTFFYTGIDYREIFGCHVNKTGTRFLAILRAAIAVVPATRYALAVMGVAVASAFCMQVLGDTSPQAVKMTFVAILAMLALMVLMLVFATLATAGPAMLRPPAVVFAWVVVLLGAISSGLTVGCVFFEWPRSFQSLGHQFFGDSTQDIPTYRPSFRSSGIGPNGSNDAQVDQENAGPGGGGLEITKNQTVAQSFTVGRAGELAEIDVLNLRHHGCAPNESLYVSVVAVEGTRLLPVTSLPAVRRGNRAAPERRCLRSGAA